MRASKRIDGLCEKLNAKIKEYDLRLKRLECTHVLVPSDYQRRAGIYSSGWGYENIETAYRMVCEKCEQAFHDLTHEEYLEAQLEENSKTCKDERDKIKAQLEGLRTTPEATDED